MASKSLGQVAYEGWLGEGIGGPAWIEVAQDPYDGPAWQAAAEAVELEAFARFKVSLEEHYAVIEAAKAALLMLQGPTGSLEQRIHAAATKLAAALRELEE